MLGKNKAVFLDRDGTMCPNIPYLGSLASFRLYAYTSRAINCLHKCGFKVIVVTNQSGVGRGLFSETTLVLMHMHMKKILKRQKTFVDAIYYCPHTEEDACLCRKPNTAMIDRSVSEFNIDITKSYIIGDSLCDMELGRRVGCKTIYVGNDSTICADTMMHNLLEAVQYITRGNLKKDV